MLKKIRKTAVSLFFAMAMAVAMSVTAFASGAGPDPYATEVTFENEELKKADDKEYYFFVFTCGGMKYYYDVDAYTAEILYKNTEENS